MIKIINNTIKMNKIIKEFNISEEEEEEIIRKSAISSSKKQNKIINEYNKNMIKLTEKQEKRAEEVQEFIRKESSISMEYLHTLNYYWADGDLYYRLKYFSKTEKKEYTEKDIIDIIDGEWGKIIFKMSDRKEMSVDTGRNPDNHYRWNDKEDLIK